MKFLLVNPWIHDFSAYDLWIRPLGLLTIAKILRDNQHEVYLLNLLERDFMPPGKKRYEKWGRGRFYQEEIKKPDIFKHIPRRFWRYGVPFSTAKELVKNIPHPDVILVTSIMTYWYTGIQETIEFLRTEFPNIPIFLGGIYATLLPDHAQKSCYADKVFPGSYEKSLSELFRELGLDIDLPDWREIIPLHELLNNKSSVVISTSRGCPYRCAYCASRLLSDRFVQRNILNIEKELNYLSDLGVSDIAFYDDALLYNSDVHIKPLLHLITKKQYCFRFHTPNGLHCEFLDSEIARLFKKSNFKTIRLSLETISGKGKEYSRNKVTLESFIRTVRYLREVGYSRKEIEVYVLVGLPGQTVEEVEETVQFISNIGGYVKLALYSPIPGTDLYNNTEEDPLYHNKIYIQYTNPDIPIEKFRRLEKIIRELNDCQN